MTGTQNMIGKIRYALGATALAAAWLSLSSCATVEDGGDEDAAAMQPVLIEFIDPPADAAAEEAAGGAEAEPLPAEPVVYRGNDVQMRMPAKKDPAHFVGDDVSLNFEQAPLEEVMHVILGDILQVDYVVDHAVKGQVTLRTRTPIPRDRLLGVLESLLKSNGALMIRGSDGRYLVTGSQQGLKVLPGVSNPASLSPGYSTIVVPLQYISASGMAEILRPMAEESAFVRIDNPRNLLMLAGTSEQLSGWLDVINTFDIDMLKGMSVGVFPLENGSAEETAVALNALVGGETGRGVGLTGAVRVIPVSRLNSVLVVTPRAHLLDTMRIWIDRLDEAPNSMTERRLFVYPVQNTTAAKLAKLLNSIYAGGGGGASVVESGGSTGSLGRDDTGGVAPGMTPETLGGGSPAGGVALESGGDFGNEILAVGVSAGDGNNELDNVRIVADDENNSLMIYASGRQYKKIRAALTQLDVVATQVLIEASIIEVGLTDSLKYGLEWTFKNGLGSDYDGTGLLANTGGPAAVIPGFSYTVTNSIGDISAVLNALSKEGLLNVISTPSVMVLDNHEAFIHVGQQVPVFGQQTETDGGRITQSVEYRDTGVKLTVRPSVNAGGLVTMSVQQSVTDIGEEESTTGQRRFLERLIESRVAVRSGESVVLGGLIREKASSSSGGVPVLHKLPLVGPLFGTVTEEDERTELLVIITPRALYNEEELRQLSEEMRQQVRYLELIEPPS